MAHARAGATDAGFSIPRIDGRLLLTILLAGSVATVAFDLFGQSLSPMLGFANLAPVPLANQTIQSLFGMSYEPGAQLLHYIAGLIAYPVGWLFIFRPLQQRFVPTMSMWLSAALYGVGLWVFALFFMAYLINGNPPFLGFTGITWVALVGHVIFALVAAWVVAWRERATVA